MFLLDTAVQRYVAKFLTAISLHVKIIPTDTTAVRISVHISSHSGAFIPRGQLSRGSCETGLRPGNLCCNAAKLAPGHTSP